MLTPPQAYELFQRELTHFCESRYQSDEGLFPAIRYALLGPGKRTRPILCLLSANLFDLSLDQVIKPAIAVEMIHTYSLVHDDLPSIDNDALRRGRPTTHMVYGEAFALLVGDALLTDAFSLLSEEPQAGALIRELADAAGGRSMVQGQALDIYWTGRSVQSREILDQIHALKTGRLLGAACSLAAIAAGADQHAVSSLRRFGQILGHAFQICDDLLDDSDGTGKSSGKDKKSGKLTYLSLMPRSEALTMAEKLNEDALSELKPWANKGSTLKQFAESLLRRQY